MLYQKNTLFSNVYCATLMPLQHFCHCIMLPLTLPVASRVPVGDLVTSAVLAVVLAAAAAAVAVVVAAVGECCCHSHLVLGGSWGHAA